MKLITLILTILVLSGYANDIVNIEKSTIQKYNLEDLDRDGVIEARDKCENTPLGASIDNSGCSNVQKNVTTNTLSTTMKWTIYTAEGL